MVHIKDVVSASGFDLKFAAEFSKCLHRHDGDVFYIDCLLARVLGQSKLKAKISGAYCIEGPSGWKRDWDKFYAIIKVADNDNCFEIVEIRGEYEHTQDSADCIHFCENCGKPYKYKKVPYRSLREHDITKYCSKDCQARGRE